MRPAFPRTFFCILLLLFSNAAAAQRPEPVVQAGHREYPRSAAFAPDGRTFATASRDRRR